MLDVKENFFRSKKPEPVTMALIQWTNDPKFREGFAMWLHQNYDSLVKEYREHGRFLTVKETEDIL